VSLPRRARHVWGSPPLPTALPREATYGSACRVLRKPTTVVRIGCPSCPQRDRRTSGGDAHSRCPTPLLPRSPGWTEPRATTVSAHGAWPHVMRQFPSLARRTLTGVVRGLREPHLPIIPQDRQSPRHASGAGTLAVHLARRLMLGGGDGQPRTTLGRRRPWRTEAPKACLVRRPVPWGPAIAPPRGGNHGPSPAVCSGGICALVHCAHRGHHAACNTLPPGASRHHNGRRTCRKHRYNSG
jgi:hypothetical protein